MSGLENMKQRLKYRGGIQEDRMSQDKLNTLRKALLYSYQACTAQLFDGREFRCLINPNKNSGDYDNKILSIPFRDICLNSKKEEKTSDGREDIGVKPGDVFKWKETDTHWLIYLRYLEEDAYFRAQIRRCDQQAIVNGIPYWVYIRGPVETSIPYNQKSGVEWNDMNYSLVMYITKDENTLDFFHRFATLKIKEDSIRDIQKTWQVVNANQYFGDGIIEVYLDEYFENTIKDKKDEEDRLKEEENAGTPPELPYIDGPEKPKPYSRVTYSIKGLEGGQWFISRNGKVESLGESDSVTFEIDFSRGKFILIYKKDDSKIEREIPLAPF